ncbi:MAG: AMED_5909 family protein [Pseudonocardiaceae bacterium]
MRRCTSESRNGIANRRSRTGSPLSHYDPLGGAVERHRDGKCPLKVRVLEKTVISRQPRTLMQAHEELVRIRPGGDASLQVWLAYYQRSAVLYDHIAGTDPGHELEARYWARRERDHARGIAVRISAETSG